MIHQKKKARVHLQRGLLVGLLYGQSFSPVFSQKA
jgi:hypothetical protein